ncbi:hypothetical protein BDV95DRAFT_599075 [Massariosphaeria phaeospora]|uniref:Fungal calcium binding protein domain-containing protein n=1 Tax=Massariosphaeria phaeospora TaxID=100035 RepID=A0A7C8M2H4_9PLEO|nr:hypothetical protein BDV95DRAFT_599075 [Massariosphaeria phaeospora]
MLSKVPLLALFTFLTTTSAAVFPRAVNTTEACPTATEYACFDVINSSLCLSQNAQRGTADQMPKCVEYEGAFSDLSGAAKLCRCPGCHSKMINDVIAKAFPSPCPSK